MRSQSKLRTTTIKSSRKETGRVRVSAKVSAAAPPASEKLTAEENKNPTRNSEGIRALQASQAHRAAITAALVALSLFRSDSNIITICPRL